MTKKDFNESLRSITQEREQAQRGSMTPRERAEMSQGDDLALLAFSATALLTVSYVLLGEGNIGLLWVAVLSLTIITAALILRFRHPL